MYLPAQNIGDRMDAQFASACMCGGRNGRHLQKKLERYVNVVGFLA